MAIYGYDVISEKPDKNKARLYNNNILIIPNIKKRYKYYLECSRINNKYMTKEYIILLSNTKFDDRCYTCRVDDYARLHIKVHNELKDYINNEMKIRNNINVEYSETENEYDIFIIE